MSNISIRGKEVSIDCTCGIKSGSPHEAMPDGQGRIYFRPDRLSIICADPKSIVDRKPCADYWDINFGPNSRGFDAVPRTWVEAIARAVKHGYILINEGKMDAACGQCGNPIIANGRDITLDYLTGEPFCCEPMPSYAAAGIQSRFVTIPGQRLASYAVPIKEIGDKGELILRA